MGLRFAIAVAAIVALIGIFAGHNSNVRREAIQKERASVEQQAKKKDAKAQTARAAAAARPDGVLSRYCRDCGKSGAVPIVEASDGLKK